MPYTPDHPIVSVGTLNISPRAKELVNKVLDANRLSYGPMSEEFEQKFANLHGCRFGILCNSGTSALHLSLAAMKELHGWQDGDEVIIPAIAFIADANIVVHNRMTPVLVDVDPLYYEIDPELIEAAITPRCRAIIPVHAFGQPCDMDPILEIAGRNNLKVIEDSAETMFARYKGRSVGSLSDIACFSTYAAHLLTTGVGGVVTTNSPEYAVKLRSLMNHGRDSIYLNIDDDNEISPDELRMVVERRFSFVSLGHSFRLTEMEAALGLAQLEDWEEMILSRRQNAAMLSKGLAESEDQVQLPAIRQDCEHSFMMYPIVLREQNKVEFVNTLEQQGVETRDMLPLTNQPLYKRLLGIEEGDFPVAKWINDSGFYIGCHQDLKDSDLTYAIDTIGSGLARRLDEVPRQGATLVLVSYNSEAAIQKQIEDLPSDLFDDAIAVDLGSTDDSVANLIGRGVRVFPADGKDPIAAVGKMDGLIGENIVFYRLDGRLDPKDIPRLLLILEQGSEMVIASRFMQGGERHDWDSRFAYRSTGKCLGCRQRRLDGLEYKAC